MREDVQFIERDAFLRQFGATYARLFWGWAREDSPFANKAWEQLLVPDEAGFFEPDLFAAFGRAIAATRDSQVVLTISSVIPPHETSAVTSWTMEDIQHAHRASYIHIFDYATFGRSGAWAAMSYHDEFTRIAGEPPFVEAFAQSLGGREAVKQRFLEFQKTGWDAPKDVQAKILASVGWRTPSQA